MGTTHTAKVLTANYRHDCPADCGQPIRPGDRIIHEDGGFVHEQCHDPFLHLAAAQSAGATSPAELQPGEVVCGSCNLVHKGECW